MTRFLAVVLLFAVHTLFAEDLLLDDFATGNGKNALGLYWYYYSDVNDSGNSVIHGATPLAGGAWSEVVFAGRDSASDRCAKLDYTLGDASLYHESLSEPTEDYNAFVGIGTDVAELGATVDLSSVDSMSFYVWSSCDSTLEFRIEFVVDEDSDNCNHAYYGTKVMIEEKNTWQRFVVDTESIEYPGWGCSLKYRPPKKVALSMIRKINWRIVASLWPGFCNENGGSGTLLIDDVVLHGIDRVPEWKTIPVVVMDNHRKAIVKSGVTGLFDILGRSYPQSKVPFLGSGLLLRRTGTEIRPFLNNLSREPSGVK